MSARVLRLEAWRDDAPELGPECAACGAVLHPGDSYLIDRDRERDVLTIVCEVCREEQPKQPERAPVSAPQPLPSLPCPVCGQPFKPVSHGALGRQRTCSKRCGATLRWG